MYIIELTDGIYSFLKVFDCSIEDAKQKAKEMGWNVAKIYEAKEI